MELTLKFFATFREAVGSKIVDRSFPDATTVGDVLEVLEAEYDGLHGNLLQDGDLKPQINVLLNGREVLHMDGVDTAIDDGDTLAVFPPVAGGSVDCGRASEDAEPATARTDGGDADSAAGAPQTEIRVEAYRGISRRLAVHYLRNLGGDADGPDEAVTEVAGDGWRASVAADKVAAAGAITLTEVTVTFEGDPAVLDELIDRFGQKAMRAGG
jgi:molybdopterin synthase sulfur carrier subunit